MRLADGRGRVRPAADRHRRCAPGRGPTRPRRRWTGCSRCARATTPSGCGSGWSPGRARVLVIGGGFTGSEVASVCRELGLPVTVAERRAGPAGRRARRGRSARSPRDMQREHGVDLRCGVTVAGAGGRRGRAAAPRPPLRRRRARRRRGGGRARRRPQHRVAAGLGAGGRRPGRGLRRGVPRLRRQRPGHRRRLRRRGRGALAAPALRLPVPGSWSTGATPSSRPRIAAHNMVCAPVGALRPPAAAGVLVQPVRRQHQVRRGPDVRRRGGRHPGLGCRSAASSPPTGGPDAWSPRSPSTRQVAGGLRGADRGTRRRSRRSFTPPTARRS